MWKGVFLLPLLVCSAWGHALCSDTTSAQPQPNLNFCTMYQNESCCLSNDADLTKLYHDSEIAADFNALTVDAASQCGTVLKKMMCTKCDPWSAHLRGDISSERTAPILCSTFCSTVWTACKDVTMNAEKSPFGVALLSAAHPTEADFCTKWGATSGYCFNGEPYVDPEGGDFTSAQGFCLDRVAARVQGGEAQITMAAIDNKVYLASREGLISAYQITPRGPFVPLGSALDIRPRITLNGEGGLLGMAFHPTTPTRFFVSYICDPTKFDDCRWDRQCTNDAGCITPGICLGTGRCGCTSNDNCGDGGVCMNGNCMNGRDSNHLHMTIIAEYTVDAANPNKFVETETKRILEVSRPGANHNGGQILFGPDGYLYVFMGDGGGNGARSSQDSRSLLGKVLRLNVDSGAARYIVPQDNPWVGNSSYRPEIWAEGFRNPWRNSFDFATQTLWVGDVGDNAIEEVNKVLPGKNYGWRKFEGSIQKNSDALDPKPDASENTLPKMSYTHASLAPANGACVIGGYWYRGPKNACWNGKYVFSDQLGVFFGGKQDGPADSDLYEVQRVSWSCGSDASSNLKCNVNGVDTRIQTIYSLGEDSFKNVYWLTDIGLMQLVENSRCPSIDCGNVTIETSAQGTTVRTTQGTTVAGNTQGTALTTAGTTQGSVNPTLSGTDSGQSCSSSGSPASSTLVPSSDSSRVDDEEVMSSSSLFVVNFVLSACFFLIL